MIQKILFASSIDDTSIRTVRMVQTSPKGDDDGVVEFRLRIFLSQDLHKNIKFN